MIQKFSNELEEECEIQYSLPSSLKNMSFISTNINPLPVFVLFYFLFILIVFFYYSRNRKKIAICRLWGYTHVQIYSMVSRFIYMPLFLPLVLNGLLVGGIIYRDDKIKSKYHIFADVFVDHCVSDFFCYCKQY